MKVLCLQASPRKKGSTATMLGWVEEALAAAGHETERVEVAKRDISGCISCFRCQQDPDELICAVADDAQAILKSMTEADAIVYATPLYCWDFAGQIKPLLDRHLSLVTGYLDPATHRSHIEGKRLALLVTCGGPVGEGNTDTISTIFGRMAGFAKADLAAELIVPGCMSADDLTEEHKGQAAEFAAQVAG